MEQIEIDREDKQENVEMIDAQDGDDQEVEHIEEEEQEINIEYLNEKVENIMKKYEKLNVDEEIGEKEKQKDTRIIIEKIELENFKSYGGVRTITPLHQRFNAVVGPNGSGKSNLMESLLFVFGKRANKMRLKKLNELIHNSTKLNNLRNARVTIFFKEIKDQGETFLTVPNSHFVLSREVYRNGSSKYFFNNEELSFDRIAVILNSKGIDLKHNRFLILQGEVEQISMMKPKSNSQKGETGLLEFLEDIIGTSRYVSLIDKLSTDIDELGEIKMQKGNRVRISKNEVEQLEEVKNQSTNYYHKEKEYHCIQHLDSLLKRHGFNKEIMSYQKKIEEKNAQVQSVEKQLRNFIEGNNTIMSAYKKMQSELAEIKKAKEDLDKKNEELEETDKLKRSDIEHLSKNIHKTKTILEKLNKNFTTESEKIQNYEKLIPEKEDSLVVLQDKKNKLEKYVNEKEEEILQKTDSLQRKKTEIEKVLQPFLDKINNSKFQIEQNNNTINLIEQNTKKKVNELETTKLNYENATTNINNKQNQFSEVEKAVTNLKESLKEEKRNLETLNKEYDNKGKDLVILQQKLSEIKNSNQESNQRNVMIEKLLKAQNEGLLQGIYGRLGDLGAIDQKYDIAATTSCAKLNCIVVENPDQAAKCIEFLRKNKLGRGEFICLDKIQWVNEHLNKNFRAPDKTERVFDLIKIPNKKLVPAFYFGYRDTLVTDDLVRAQQVAYGTPRHRVVTLAGELIEVSGVMSGCGKPSRGGMSNKIANEVNPEEIMKISNDFNILSKEHDGLRTEKQNLERKIQQINQQIIEHMSINKKIESELDQLDKIKRDLDKVLTTLKKDESKLNKATEEIQNLRNTNTDLEENIKQDEKESKPVKEEFEKVLIEINKNSGDDFLVKKDELKKLKKEVDVLNKEIEMMKHTINKAPENFKKIQDEMENKQNNIKELEDKINAIKEELNNIEVQAMETYAKIEINMKQNEEKKLEINEKMKELQEFKQETEKLKEERTKVKEDIVNLNQEVKRVQKTEDGTNEEIKKNLVSFKKLIDEFGFIDRFEKEVDEVSIINI